MVTKKVLVLGASGQIGRHLIRILTKNNYVVTAITRNLHRKGYLLKTQSPIGFLEIVEENIFNQEKLNNIIKKHDICINLVGILFEKKNNTFQNIHVNFPSILSKLCKENNIEQLIHISALGIDNAEDSIYAKSKINGENLVKENFNRSVILKPSICFSVDDRFSTKFMSLLNILPIMPLYYKGRTKFTPIHATDMANIIYEVINRKITGETIECIGPEVLTFKEIILKLLKAIDKKRLLIPLPLIIAKMTARIFELMPKPLLTQDQLRLLRYDSVVSGKYKTNFDLGLNADRKFDKEIEKYSFNWRSGGQYSRDKVSSTD